MAAVRDQRHGRRRWAPELLVLLILVAAVCSSAFDLGGRWLGLTDADPVTEPAAVLPPEGLRLPETAPAEAVAGRASTGDSDPARVAALLRPLARAKVLGPHFGVLVTDLGSGRVLHQQGARALTPASTTKVLTGTAALEALGPMARFRTTVRWEAQSGRLVLVGGGDPYLASKPVRGAAYPPRADVVTLARKAVASLRALGVRRVSLAYDESYFTGPAINPAWPADYVPDGVVPPITPLWVDQGLQDDGYGYVGDPSRQAAASFASALRAEGLRVAPQVSRVSGTTAGREVAEVSSAPLGEIVEHTLAVSDNQAAEVLARHVGLAERQEGSFTAGATSVLAVLERLGVDTSGDRLYDGSGLSRRNVLTPTTLVSVLRTAASDGHPELRQVISGLPVAGFTGSLAYRFDQGPDVARGRVRAKTGTLTGVHGLAGIADDVGGGRMAFVVVADRVPPAKEGEAVARIDRIAAELGACRCGVGSGS